MRNMNIFFFSLPQTYSEKCSFNIEWGNNIFLNLYLTVVSGFLVVVTKITTAVNDNLATMSNLCPGQILQFSALHISMYPICTISHSHPRKHFNMHDMLSVMGKQE